MASTELAHTARAKPARRSEAKRSAILTAGRELFVRDGVDHVSMDAVATAANVSKATLYSHFGSKQQLYTAILGDVGQALQVFVDRSLALHLDEPEILTLEVLEASLVEFGTELALAMTGPTGFGGVLTMVNQRHWQTTDPEDEVATDPVVDALSRRFERFQAQGLLDITDPRTAAMHFGALTLLLAGDDQPDPHHVNEDRVRTVVSDGVRTFVRAFRA